MIGKPDSTLIAYIQRNLQRGYSMQVIEATLFKSGYDPKAVRTAADYVFASKTYKGANPYTQTNVRPMGGTTRNPAHMVLIVVIILAAVLIIAATVLLFTSGADSVDVPETTSAFDDTTPNSDDTSSPGDSGSGSAQTINFNDQPGGTTSGGSNQNDLTVEFASGTLTTGQILDQVRAIGANNPQQAASLCAQIESDSASFNCYATLALLAKDTAYCGPITDTQTRDSCYVELVIRDVASENTCDLVVNEFSKRSCKQLFGLSQTITAETETRQTFVAPIIEEPEEAPFVTVLYGDTEIDEELADAARVQFAGEN
ncbi:MAG: hypothetical protein ACI8Y7_000626 [Candidatus Woesearchaeota archaeon]|jgi:hypothetical protein